MVINALCICVLVASWTVSAAPDAGVYLRVRRDEGNVRPARVFCVSGFECSPKAVNTTEILERLREQMVAANISAYIITTSDDHQSEYIASHDKRRQYVSGFSGSYGDAVVTLTSAALWTDSRYYLQADEQLDCNWNLMKLRRPGFPTIAEWLSQELVAGDTVSADPRIATYSEWIGWMRYLKEKDIPMKVHLENLVDNIWGTEEDRPHYSTGPVVILSTNYTGATWQEKLARLRSTVDNNKCEVMVVTALDEIAWLLNLRGDDVPFTPVFRAYLIVAPSAATLYIPQHKMTAELEQYLNPDQGVTIQLKNYTDFWSDLQSVGKNFATVLVSAPYSYNKGASYLVHMSLPDDKVALKVSPVLSMKTRKNAVEAQGMRAAHIRDAVALCQFLATLESEVIAGKYWDELLAVEALDLFRAEQDLGRGASFGTIAAFGANAALPHYEPTNITNKVIDTSALFMVDSGGQYLDGTTDVTRTVHLGTPTAPQREIYTSLLMGCINLVTTKFPEGQKLMDLEVLVRTPLYQLGLDYGHGSTHGIGSFLSVHESFNLTYHENFFGSQEPGYYKDNEFGMRLENIVTVVKANVTYNTTKQFLTFEPVTLVPYEAKLINVDDMEDNQIRWLNDYHSRVREVVGAELLRQGRNQTYQWLLNKTQQILSNKIKDK